MTDNRIYAGFDLSFIDVDIRPFTQKNSSELIEDLPLKGSHHVETDIEFKPGGNGFNLCRTLASLGRHITFVGPTSPLFESLVKEKNIKLELEPIENAEVNITSILNLAEGEVQFNSVKGFLAPEHLNSRVTKLFHSSTLKTISNISLNYKSIEWVSSLLLSIINPEDPILFSSTISFDEKISRFNDTSYEGIIFIDPCDLSKFGRMKELMKILKQLKKLEGEKYLSVNEFELNAFTNAFDKSPEKLSEYLCLPIILHTKKSVRFWGKECISLQTNTLSKTVTFVGAGDCFNGGFLDEILKSSSLVDALKAGISSASYLIETGKYPTES